MLLSQVVWIGKALLLMFFLCLKNDGLVCYSLHHPIAEVLCSSHSEIVASCINEKISMPTISAEFRFVSSVNEINNILMSEQPTISVTDINNKKFATAVLHTGILLSSHKNVCSVLLFSLLFCFKF